ncbi:MAG TPA: 50S ribosomal protein L29 [Candidatus Acidoferrales bacterium]|nr:50S ribosomal protein L29 [Candidatus Acidoferrales bacterium]
MQASELRALSDAELAQKRRELIDDIFHLRLKRGTGQLENPMRLRQAKRDLARVETVLRERERQA